MKVLIDRCGEVAVFRPPPVEKMTGEEARRLQAKLSEVVGAWRGAGEIGMRVSGRHLPSAEARADSEDVWFGASAAPVALRLTPRAAVALLCVNLGAEMPDAPDTALSEVDLALLEAWAARAVPDLVAALDAGPAGDILRRAEPPGWLNPKAETAMVTELTFVGEAPAGAIALGIEVARKREGVRAPTLADCAELLLQAKVTVQATISAEPAPLPELLSLECGDVLLLGNKIAVEATLSAGDAVVAAGRPGAREGMRALRVRETVLNDHTDRLGETSDGC